MNGLSKEVDLSFLNGREVIQVAIGIHQVIFSFDEEITISVEGEFRFDSTEGPSTWKPGAPQAASSAIRLLGTTIERVDGREDGTLRLTFSNRDCLTIFDNNKDFESYQISRPGATIVV